jgi:hypothetical protein
LSRPTSRRSKFERRRLTSHSDPSPPDTLEGRDQKRRGSRGDRPTWPLRCRSHPPDPTGQRVGDIVLVDSTNFTTLLGGTDSLTNLWHNLATMK